MEAILQVRINNPDSHILVTAGSNSACDTIAERLCEFFKHNTRLQTFQQQNSSKFLLRIYSKSVFRKGMTELSKELLMHSNCKNSLHEYPPVDEIQKHGIIVATLCSVAKLVTGGLGSFKYFTHIFIDEAAACTEPEALMGIMGIKHDFLNNCSLILSGDHKQLGPVLKSDTAADLGLQLSLMERLLNNCECYAVNENGNYDNSLQARLRRNYRSHPAIVKLYNHLYYNNELIAEAKMGEFLYNNELKIK